MHGKGAAGCSNKNAAKKLSILCNQMQLDRRLKSNCCGHIQKRLRVTLPSHDTTHRHNTMVTDGESLQDQKKGVQIC